ncbi:MAG: hypothetical protein R3Y58_10405 [Eubacteriales bacterium]
MRYYEIKRDYQLYNTLQIKRKFHQHPRMSQESFDKPPKLIVNYFHKNTYMQYTDFLFEPILLISDGVKKVFELYEDSLKYKRIQLFCEDVQESTEYVYNFPYIKFLECLSVNTEYFPNKTIKKIVIDEKKITNHHVFYIKDILDLKLIVSHAVVESILRRGLYGVIFEEVEIK